MVEEGQKTVSEKRNIEQSTPTVYICKNTYTCV